MKVSCGLLLTVPLQFVNVFVTTCDGGCMLAECLDPEQEGENLDCFASPIEQMAVMNVKFWLGNGAGVLCAATPERGIPCDEIEQLFPERRTEFVEAGGEGSRILQRYEDQPIEGLVGQNAVRSMLDRCDEAGEVHLEVLAVLAVEVKRRHAVRWLKVLSGAVVRVLLFFDSWVIL